MPIFTKTAAEIFAPTTGGGAPRGPVMSEAQTWGTEVEGAIEDIGLPETSTFTPTVTLVGGAGNTVPVYSTNSGRYMRIGNRVFVDILLTGDGGAEGAGTGQINVALPVAASASFPAESFPAGNARNSAAEYAIHVEIAASATKAMLYYFDTISNRSSFTGDLQNNTTRFIRLSFNYEV